MPREDQHECGDEEGDGNEKAVTHSLPGKLDIRRAFRLIQRLRRTVHGNAVLYLRFEDSENAIGAIGDKGIVLSQKFWRGSGPSNRVCSR